MDDRKIALMFKGANDERRAHQSCALLQAAIESLLMFWMQLRDVSKQHGQPIPLWIDAEFQAAITRTEKATVARLERLQRDTLATVQAMREAQEQAGAKVEFVDLASDKPLPESMPRELREMIETLRGVLRPARPSGSSQG